jgi:hypothetical protein
VQKRFPLLREYARIRTEIEAMAEEDQYPPKQMEVQTESVDSEVKTLGEQNQLLIDMVSPKAQADPA